MFFSKRKRLEKMKTEWMLKNPPRFRKMDCVVVQESEIIGIYLGTIEDVECKLDGIGEFHWLYWIVNENDKAGDWIQESEIISTV